MSKNNLSYLLAIFFSMVGGCAQQQTLETQTETTASSLVESPSSQTSQAIKICPRQFISWNLIESLQTDSYALALCQKGESVFLVGHEKNQHEAFIDARVQSRTKGSLLAEEESGFSYQISQGQLIVTHKSKPVSQEKLWAPTSAGRDNYAVVELDSLSQKNINLTTSAPKATVLEAFGLVERPEGNFQEKIEVSQLHPKQLVVILTQLNLPDDSLRGLRYKAIFAATASSAQQQWQMSWVGRQQLCRPGRGAQEWSAKLCL